MNLQDIIQMEINYVSLFSKATETSSGFIFQDDHQTDKYYHNYFHVTLPISNLDDIQSYIQNHEPYGFVVVRIEEPIDSQNLFDDYEMSHNGYFYAKLMDLNLKETSIEPTLVNPNDDQSFFDFMYDEDLQFGTSYAIGNVKRQKEVLTQNTNHYFYIQVKEADQVIGHLNGFLAGKLAKIDDFYVKETYQKQGYGSALMLDMVRRLSEKGVTDVYLVTDLAGTAQHLYRKMGFTQVGSFKQYQKIYNK